VPLPPDAAARRRSRTGDAYRGHDYTGKRWREEDLPALGRRYREPYATKAAFLTLAIEDGPGRRSRCRAGRRATSARPARWWCWSPTSATRATSAKSNHEAARHGG
jgi:hypothetical protein